MTDQQPETTEIKPAEAAGPEQTQPVASEAAATEPMVANDDLGQLQAAAAAEEKQPEAPPKPDRGVATEMVIRFLGHQSITARDLVAELNDDEARAVILAGGDRFTARVQIKSIFSRAYDRRQSEAALEARDRAEAAVAPAEGGADHAAPSGETKAE